MDNLDRLHNQKTYGEAWTNAQLAIEVACYLSKLVDSLEPKPELPGYVKGWIEAHKKSDEERDMYKSDSDAFVSDQLRQDRIKRRLAWEEKQWGHLLDEP